ncbi:glycoside hydrolase family 13 protein [Demequina sp. TTPB684]|uniref:glycoside hydrolase family 13 protein n=1 Tax=unclassified Demequina TaxID=2620311 RepID=UPI001CF12D43|nr:glycoside hydrolase family 13 protein [Demequina sp. TMPB413]MCB2414006.1 glycoside hydrolase family 13 protein [Demequina sp. TTPB684]UPU89113.1 glycoside hydrolase family 13 protein [Demequina sp. TMPB413]
MQTSESLAPVAAPADKAHDWWRSAVIYQIYPRSFADASGDGIGDLRGVTQHLTDLVNLGVDAVWLSPFYASPQKDAGYDVADYRQVDPLFGTLSDVDDLIDTAHGLGLRVIADIVPNHTSSDHAWFLEALAEGPGSPARDRYLFREGKGKSGELPPNNWQSVFGGPAWTRVTEADATQGQWYLHLFDSSQPDLNWENEAVREEFDDILRFWLDRGIDGMRVDVAHGLIKAPGLPDYTPDPSGGSMGGDEELATPYFGQQGVHDVWRRWRAVVAEYGPDRILVAEAWIRSLSRMAEWVRPDEMHQAFNFSFLECPWDAAAMRDVISRSLSEFGAVGAPSTWVLSNHDVVRHASRLAVFGENPQGHGIGPLSEFKPDRVVGLQRARATTLVMLGLPGSSYIYQGEELGLPEHIDIPDEARQDPTWRRTNGERYGRDGCRVPLPWNSAKMTFGFSSSGRTWLPQPREWEDLARDVQDATEGSTLRMYKAALAHRRTSGLGDGSVEWVELGEDVVAFDNNGIRVIANLSADPVPFSGRVLVSSAPVHSVIPPSTAAWIAV